LIPFEGEVADAEDVNASTYEKAEHMTEFKHNQLDRYLSETSKKTRPSVYLIFGEEMLCRSVLKKLTTAILPASSMTSNYEVIDGAQEHIPEVIERANTFSLFSQSKIIAVVDSRIFYSKVDEHKLLERAKLEYEKENVKSAANCLLDLMGMLNLSFEDVSRQNRKKTLKLDGIDDDHRWFDEILAYCGAHQLAVRSSQKADILLQRAIEKGFPAGNHLIITTDVVDKRKRLYRSIKDKGVIFDCSVPRGNRKADRTAQEAVVKEKVEEILRAADRKIENDAYRLMYEKIGFDLRAINTGLEKLIAYAGDRERITVSDVERVLQRTKKDPLYEFTNAVTDRHLDKAIFYLNSLLEGGDIAHPLQLLAAVVNQIRRLILIKDFCAGPLGDGWHASCDYQFFKERVLPAVVAYDDRLREKAAQWKTALSSRPEGGGQTSKKKKGKKKSRSTDLIIAKNPGNPFPVYKMMQKSSNFSMRELIDIHAVLVEADARLKSTGSDPKIILENMILSICRSTN
jgi:DNA polymerase-3 subunit delta